MIIIIIVIIIIIIIIIIKVDLTISCFCGYRCYSMGYLVKSSLPKCDDFTWSVKRVSFADEELKS